MLWENFLFRPFMNSVIFSFLFFSRHLRSFAIVIVWLFWCRCSWYEFWRDFTFLFFWNDIAKTTMTIKKKKQKFKILWDMRCEIWKRNEIGSTVRGRRILRTYDIVQHLTATENFFLTSFIFCSLLLWCDAFGTLHKDPKQSSWMKLWNGDDIEWQNNVKNVNRKVSRLQVSHLPRHIIIYIQASHHNNITIQNGKWVW